MYIKTSETYEGQCIILSLNTVLTLRLHYVPGSHGGHGSSKRSSPWDFGEIFACYSSFVASRYVLSRSIKVVVTKRELKRARPYGAVRFCPRSVTDAFTFPHGLPRSDTSSHVSLRYNQGLLRFSSCVKAHYGLP